MRERSRLGKFIHGQVRNQADAEDILQDVFYQFVEASRLLAVIEQTSAWLFRVARYRIVDRFRKRKERPSPRIDGCDDDDDLWMDLPLPAADHGPEAAYQRSLLLETLEDALQELPQSQREVFVAHEFDGMSFKHLSVSSGIPLNTLLSRKRYAVLYLRERLQTVYDELAL
jgi:RNA polymerase sigma factor (sigma-70 family)